MVLLGKEDNFKDRIWKVLSKRRSKIAARFSDVKPKCRFIVTSF